MSPLEHVHLTAQVKVKSEPRNAAVLETCVLRAWCCHGNRNRAGVALRVFVEKGAGGV